MNTTTETTEGSPRSPAEANASLSGRVQERIRQTQARLSGLQQNLVDRSKYAAYSTDTYIHEKPWSAICAAVSAGFILGIVLSRR